MRDSGDQEGDGSGWWVVGATVKARSRGRKEKTEWREALGGEEARPRDSWAVVGGKVRQRKADTWVSTVGMQAPWDELRDEDARGRAGVQGRC